MIAQQIRKFDMLRRVQQFLDEFAAKLFGATASAARLALDQLVEDMRVNEAAQASNTLSAKSQTAAQEVLRDKLVKDHMRPVALIAAAHLRDVPEFKALQVPKGGVKAAVPLGVCLLPAFVLVGVVPLVAGSLSVLLPR